MCRVWWQVHKQLGSIDAPRGLQSARGKLQRMQSGFALGETSAARRSFASVRKSHKLGEGSGSMASLFRSGKSRSKLHQGGPWLHKSESDLAWSKSPRGLDGSGSEKSVSGGSWSVWRGQRSAGSVCSTPPESPRHAPAGAPKSPTRGKSTRFSTSLVGEGSGSRSKSPRGRPSARRSLEGRSTTLVRTDGDDGSGSGGLLHTQL